MCVQPEFANYNVKTIGFPDDQWDWCEEQHYPFRVFINSDGGGYTGWEVKDFRAIKLSVFSQENPQRAAPL